MPYIKQDKRDKLDSAINDLHTALVGLELDDETNNMEGNLNYAITRLLRMCYGKSYGEINDVMGLITCIGMEYYRTIAGPYEDQKKFENGDVDAGLVMQTVDEIVVEHHGNEVDQ